MAALFELILNQLNQPKAEFRIYRVVSIKSHSLSMTWYTVARELAQTAFYLVGIGSTIVGVKSYIGNSRLERAKWIVRMYEKFYEAEELKKIRETLDCPTDSEIVSGLVEDQSSKLTDYLNFFELLAILKNSRQMQGCEIEAMFGYYLDCIQKQPRLMSYLRNSSESGFERLANYLKNRNQS